MKQIFSITFVLFGFFSIFLRTPAPVFAQDGLDTNNEIVSEVLRIQNKYTPDLMNIPGVVGTGTGLDLETHQVVIEVYVEQQNPGLEQQIPKTLEGISVKVVAMGKIYIQ
ncbi:MAG: hypothetical protein HY268_18895 [Deltaproteobacteria bacterium]|nr:hypothetical protein [Deltaproteobacteria bacterium]